MKRRSSPPIPLADNTDTYAFVSPDAPDTVTLIANWIPLEAPGGGPNFYKFGDDVLYRINIDNNGDAKDDIVYEFRFKTRIRNKHTFLYNTGPIASIDDPNFNMRQTYTVTRIDRHGRRVLGSDLATPPVNVGLRSTPNYETLGDAGIHTLADGSKVFAGQRDDPFFVDLGSVFDLLGLRPFNPAHLIPLPGAPGVDGLNGVNVHTIALQVPKNKLTHDGSAGTDPANTNSIIGVYSTTLRKRLRLIDDDDQDRIRRMGAGVEARDAAGERGRDSGRAEGSLQRLGSGAGRAVRRAGEESRTGEAHPGPVSRSHGSSGPAQRPGRDLPHRHSGTQSACRRQALGDAPLEHGLRAITFTEPARPARWTERRVPQRPPAH